MTFRFVAEPDVIFDATESLFRGFGCVDSVCDAPNADEIDVVVGRRSAIAEPTEVCASFRADTHGEDSPLPFMWSLCTCLDGSEVISVFYDEGGLVAAQAVLHAPGRVSLLVEPRNNGRVVPAYVFPVFNILMSRLLMSRGGFLVHCSVVRTRGGRGLLFTAPSGTGKSTMAGLWASYAQASIVNDDMIAVRPDADGRPVAHNMPMAYYQQPPDSVVLRGIFLLRQSPSNELQRLSSPVAKMRFASNVVQQPLDASSAKTTLDNVLTAIGQVPIFDLGFRPDADVVRLISGEEL